MTIISATSSKVLLSYLLVVLATGFASAATVRGRVVYKKSGRAALGYIVTLWTEKGRSSPAHVGADGMYYIFNIHGGEYHLQVWAPAATTPCVDVPIRVAEPYIDVPQAVVPDK